jgi:FKBP-type peptidyl-prolyl cis-trans isomerase (trigger factor)
MTKKPTSTDQKVTAKTQQPPADQKKEAPLIIPSTVLKMVIPQDQATAAFKKVLKKASRQVKVEGFRLGNAPSKLVEEKVGREKLVNLSLDELLSQAYADLIAKEKKRPLAQPEIRIISTDEGKDWEIEVLIAEKPILNINDWEKIVKKAHTLAAEEIKKNDKLTDQQKEEVQLRTIFKELIQAFKPAVPELLVKQDVNRQLDELLHQLEHLKMSLDEYLQRRQFSFEQLSSDMAMSAISGWQLEFVLDAIISEQKIEPSTQELEDYLAKYKSTKKFAELDHQVQHQLEYEVQRQKVTQLLLKNPSK